MMVRENSNIYLPNVVYTYFGEHISKAASDSEQMLDVMKRGSGGRPPRSSRDTQVLLCTLAGIVIGCGIGVFIGISTMGTGGIVMGSIFGFFGGGIIGSFAGEYLKRRKYRKLKELADKLDDNNHGPIMS